MKMVMKDFGIHSEKDLMQAAEKIAHRLESDMENCPYFQRMRKAVERMLRYAMKHVEVSDLPTGKRMEWVNDLSKQLYTIMKSETSVRDLEDFAEDIIEDTLHEVGRWMEEADRVEQKWNKNGGI